MDNDEGQVTAATVLLHTLEVVVDGSNRLKVSQKWQVRIDDPAACAAGLAAPSGLDGAADGGARVLGDFLLVPPTVAKGTVFTLETSGREYRGPYSGVFSTAPDLPLEEAKVVVQAPSWLPLTVWADPRGVPATSRQGGRRIEITWGAMAAGEPAELVWTTWKDWDEAGAKLSARVDELMTTKKALGREIASDIEGLSPTAIAERVNQIVTVYPGDYGSWEEVKPATEVFEAGEGTAADRAVAMIALMRVAGFDARPGGYRPAEQVTAAPLTVAAPARLLRPAVVVHTDRGVMWIDPSASYTALPDLPASMTGAVAWSTGQLPTKLAHHGSMDGMIAINSRIQLAEDGSASWSASIVASDAAQEWLRTLLAPLDEDGRTEAFVHLANKARPGSDRITATLSSVSHVDKPLKITINGYQAAASEVMGPGRKATVAPLLAPAIAAWLPTTRILVHEELLVEPPAGLAPLAIISPEPTHHDTVTLSRSIHREGAKTVLITEVQRPDRSNSPQDAAEASRFLDANAAKGPQLLLFGVPDPGLVKQVRAVDDGRTIAEKIATEVLIWVSAEDLKRATKTLKKRLLVGDPVEVAEAISRYGGATDARPWVAFYDAAPDEKGKLIAVRGLARAGATEQGWLRATELLAETESWATKREALLAITHLQPKERPNADASPDASHRWIEPEPLLARLEEASRQAWLPASGPDRELLLFKARYYIDQQKYAEAQLLTEELMGQHLDPLAMVLHAEASAHVETAAEDVLAEIEHAVALAPFDAEVLAAAARAMAEASRPDRAQHYAMSSARLAFTDPQLWAGVAHHAMMAGDLPTAVYSARRASDLVPSDIEHAQRLLLLATLIGDEEAATLGATRSGESLGEKSWPLPIDTLLERVPWEYVLAVLQYREHEVIQSERLLGLRGQLRLDADLFDGAARDGTILLQHFDNPRGAALSFAATAGRLWSTAAEESLTTHRASSEVRATRMEWYLIGGSGDAVADARVLAEDDPRAKTISRAAADPQKVAGELHGWPVDLTDPKLRAPAGWKVNKVLGGPAGVVAWSNSDLASAIVIVEQIIDLPLPAPLGLLYTPRVPDLASMPDGTRIMRLEGGNVPVYAAVNLSGERLVYGLGFTPQAAKRAYWAGTTAAGL